MASPNRRSVGADSVAERATLTVSPLLKRNREIAEVREQLLQADAEIDEAQARNHQLLETHSELDSERTRQLQRAALAEQRLAEQFEATQQHEERAAAQEARFQTSAEEVRLSLARLRAELLTVEREGKEEHKRQSQLEDDLSRQRAELEAKSEALSSLRQDQEQKRRSIIERWQTEAARKLQASESAQSAAAQRVRDLKRSLQATEAQLEGEKRQREELNQSLRRFMAQEAESGFDLKKLEQQVAEEGGNPEETLERYRARQRSASPGSPGRRRAEQGSALREELKNSEAQCDVLESKLTKMKSEDSSKIAKLRTSLEAARSELQTSLQEANREQQREVAQLEAQLEAEKKALQETAVEAAIVEDRISRLRSTLETRSSELRSEATGQAEKHGQVTAHLRRLREEKHEVQDSLAGCLDRRLELEAERKKAMENGSEELAQLRHRIRELWALIRQPLPKGYPMPDPKEQASANSQETGERTRFHDFVAQLQHIEELSGYSTSEVLTMLFNQQGLGVPGKRLPDLSLPPRDPGFGEEREGEREEGERGEREGEGKASWRQGASAFDEATGARSQPTSMQPRESPSTSRRMMPPMAPMVNKDLDFSSLGKPSFSTPTRSRAASGLGSQAAAAAAAAVAAATAATAERFHAPDQLNSLGRRFGFGTEWAQRSTEVQAAVLKAHASGMLTAQFSGRSPSDRLGRSRGNYFRNYPVEMQTSQVRVEELDDDADISPAVDPINPFHLEPDPTDEQMSPSLRGHLAQLPTEVFGEGLTRSQQNAQSAAVLQANAMAVVEIRRQLELSGRSHGSAAPPPIGTAVAVAAGYPNFPQMGYQRVPAGQ